MSNNLPQMRFQAVIRPCLNRDTNALALSLLGVLDSLIDVFSRVSTESVVQARDKSVSVVFGHRHERSSHNTVISLLTVIKEDSQLGTYMISTLSTLCPSDFN
jgi:hypothetical protein